MEPINTTFLNRTSLDLFIESYSSAAHVVQVRGFTKTERIGGDHTTNSDRSLATSIIPITEVPLHITARTAATGVKRGVCYVKVSLRSDGAIVALLGAGYVTDTGTIIWPYGKVESSIEGPGLIRSITGTDPAAGAEISETVPTGARWRLLGLSFSLVTDATVANRVVRLRPTDGTSALLTLEPPSAQTASLTEIYTYAIKSGYIQGVVSNTRDISLPDVILPAGYKIITSTSGIVAGDNFSAPQLLVEEWIAP